MKLVICLLAILTRYDIYFHNSTEDLNNSQGNNRFYCGCSRDRPQLFYGGPVIGQTLFTNVLVNTAKILTLDITER